MSQVTRSYASPLEETGTVGTRICALASLLLGSLVPKRAWPRPEPPLILSTPCSRVGGDARRASGYAHKQTVGRNRNNLASRADNERVQVGKRWHVVSKVPAIWSHTHIPVLSAVSAPPPARVDPWPPVYNGSDGTMCVSTLGTLAHVLRAQPWFPCWDRVTDNGLERQIPTDLRCIGIHRHDRMHKEPLRAPSHFSVLSAGEWTLWSSQRPDRRGAVQAETSSHTRLDPSGKPLIP